jgi:hypothetical protein
MRIPSNKLLGHKKENMNSPLANLPTDNLYKFFALSGVAISLSSVYLFVTKVFEYKDNLLAHKEELEFIAPLTQWGFAIGFLLAGVGFVFWYIRIQRPLDQELSSKVENAKAQTRKDREELELAKLKTIYDELSNLGRHVSIMNMQMIGDIGYGRKFNAKEIPSNQGYNSLKMHVDFYAPELAKDLKKLDDLYLKFGELIGQFVLNFSASTEEREEFVMQGVVYTKDIQSEIEKLKTKLGLLANAK